MRPDEGGAALPAELHASPLPSGMVDARGGWTDANAALRSLLGDPPSALVDVLDEPGIEVTELLTAAAGQVLRVLLPSGEPADAVVAGAVGDAGDAGARLVQLVERSEVRRLEDLAGAAATATAAFVSRVSHDLRNPIGTLNGYAELLLGDDTLGEESRRFVERILSSSSRALETLTAIVTETRASAAVAPPDAIDVGELVGGIRSELAPLLAERDAHIEVAPDLPVLRSDRTDLRRALLALVRNAVEHHPGGAQVAVSAEPVDGGWGLVVADDGPGLPADLADDATEPSGRSGLGLRLTRAAMARYGGHLELGTSEAGGVRARLVLPQRRASDPAER